MRPDDIDPMDLYVKNTALARMLTDTTWYRRSETSWAANLGFAWLCASDNKGTEFAIYGEFTWLVRESLDTTDNPQTVLAGKADTVRSAKHQAICACYWYFFVRSAPPTHLVYPHRLGERLP